MKPVILICALPAFVMLLVFMVAVSGPGRSDCVRPTAMPATWYGACYGRLAPMNQADHTQSGLWLEGLADAPCPTSSEGAL